MKEHIHANAELVRSIAKEQLGVELEYDDAGVRWLNQYIDAQRIGAATLTQQKLPSTLGSFFGECIRHSYGGDWILDKEHGWALQINQNVTVYPFSKVRKQLTSSEGESVYGLFIAIPAFLKRHLTRPIE